MPSHLRDPTNSRCPQLAPVPSFLHIGQEPTRCLPEWKGPQGADKSFSSNRCLTTRTCLGVVHDHDTTAPHRQTKTRPTSTMMGGSPTNNPGARVSGEQLFGLRRESTPSTPPGRTESRRSTELRTVPMAFIPPRHDESGTASPDCRSVGVVEVGGLSGAVRGIH